MITFEQAKKLEHGDIIYHKTYRNADKTPERWKVNGWPRTWKTRPLEILVPLKHGLYSFGYLSQFNLGDFSLTEEGAYQKGEK